MFSSIIEKIFSPVARFLRELGSVGLFFIECVYWGEEGPLNLITYSSRWSL